MTKYRNDYQGITFIPKLDDDDLVVGTHGNLPFLGRMSRCNGSAKTVVRRLWSPLIAGEMLVMMPYPGRGVKGKELPVHAFPPVS